MKRKERAVNCREGVAAFCISNFSGKIAKITVSGTIDYPPIKCYDVTVKSNNSDGINKGENNVS